MRTAILLMVCVMAGCAAEDPGTTSTSQPSDTPSLHQRRDPITGAAVIKETDKDVCALAAQLPSGDICAMMCDPDAMKAQLLSEGTPAGTCYEFSCALPDDSHVIVGVCLPPS